MGGKQEFASPFPSETTSHGAIIFLVIWWPLFAVSIQTVYIAGVYPRCAHLSAMKPTAHNGSHLLSPARKLGGFRRIAQRFYRPVLGSPYTLRLGNWLLMCDNFTIVFSARVLMLSPVTSKTIPFYIPFLFLQCVECHIFFMTFVILFFELFCCRILT